MDEGVKNTLKTFATFCWYVMMPLGVSIYLFDQPILNAFGQNPVFIWVCLAGIFNAFMDSVENEHIVSTVFRNVKPTSFWYKRDSWDKAYRLLGYKFDSWHLAKSCMIICWAMAVITYSNMFGAIYDFVLIGCVYNWVFNGFYTYLFAKKKTDTLEK